MTAHELLQELRARGITAEAQDGHVVARTPSAALVEMRLLAQLRERRAEVLAFLLGIAIHRDKPAYPCHRCHSETWWRPLREVPTPELRRRHGADAWQRTAVGGWVCTACHPDQLPREQRVTRFNDLRDPRVRRARG